MKANIYVNPFNQTTLQEKNVEVLSLSPLPRIKKNGEVFKQPYPISNSMSKYEAGILFNLYKLNVRKGKVKYSDGSIQDNVFINMNDIVEC